MYVYLEHYSLIFITVSKL